MSKCISALLILVLVLPPCLSPYGFKDEYFRKAALFRIFSRHIRWPAGPGMEDRSKPFFIGVIGKNPFGSVLEKAYAQEENKIKGKNVEIRYISEMEGIENCHILFISNSVENELESILALTRGKPILTVAETPGFAEKGVLFNLYESGDELRFEINGMELRDSGLIVDSQLLSVARIIKMPGNKK